MTQTMLNFFAALINQYLKLDPESHANLSKLSGHQAAMEITDFNLVFYILLHQEKIELTTQMPDLISVRFKADSKTFFSYMMKQIKGDETFPKDMSITGDMEFAYTLQRFFKGIHIDWEEQLAKVTGDHIASSAGKLFKKARSFVLETGQTIKENLQEYFQEELALFPNRLALEHQYQKITDLQLDVERLLLRFKRLKEIANL